MADVIRSTLRILTATGALPNDPLPDQDPYRIINSNFVGAAFSRHCRRPTARRQRRCSPGSAFNELSDAEWQRLREIGTLKALDVSFQSGTAT